MLRHAVLAAALLPVYASAWAQEPLTLRQAIEEALAKNPAARAARAGEDEAAAGVQRARSPFLPRVDVVESWQGGNQPVFVFGSLLAQQRFTEANFAIAALNRPDALSNHRAAVAVEQTLFDGARTSAALSASRLGVELAGQESRRTALDLYMTTVRAYGRAAAASAMLAAARASVESATEDVRRARERRDAGFEAEASVLALQVEAAEAEVRRIATAAEAANARAALNVAIGAPLDDQRPLAPLGDVPAVTVDRGARETAALAARPELQQSRLRERIAEAEIRAARSGFLPHVSAQASLEANGHSFADRAGSWTAAVQLRWNVFAGGADAARVAAARAAGARAAAEREGAEHAVRLELRQAFADHESALARRAAARAMVDEAVESRRIIRERYDAGLSPASELTRANALVLRAEATHIAALVDVHVSAAAIDRASGQIEKTR
jgi:outer membrane protein TolC